jgi:hypothetical protein
MNRRSFFNALVALPGLAGMTLCTKPAPPTLRVRVFEFNDDCQTTVAALSLNDALIFYHRALVTESDFYYAEFADDPREISPEEMCGSKICDDDGWPIHSLADELALRLEAERSLPFVLSTLID